MSFTGRRLNEVSAPRGNGPLITVYKVKPQGGPYAVLKHDAPDIICEQRTGTSTSLLKYVADGYRPGTCRQAAGFTHLHAFRSVWKKSSSQLS